MLATSVSLAPNDSVDGRDRRTKSVNSATAQSVVCPRTIVR